MKMLGLSQRDTPFLLIVVFLLAVGVNVVLGRYTELRSARRPSDAH